MIDLFWTMPSYMVFFIAAALALFTKGHLRSLIMVATPIISGLFLWQTGQGDAVAVSAQLLDYELLPFRTDKLSLLFGYLFNIAAFMAIIFSLHIRDTYQHVSGLIYAGSALGAVFAGDYITLFAFLEIMAVSSAFLIWARGTEKAIASGMRYLIIQVISGLLLLAGALFAVHETGTLALSELSLESVSGLLIFCAIGIKAAFPLVHNWVTDAYPEATPTGSVFLCIFTTKTAVYLLARSFPGEEVLIYVGVIMACFPIFYAVIENDLRRVLAYSMINQIGFMVVGIGIGTELAINGAVATAFNHVIYKGLLFMSMGAVLHVTGRINGSDLGGLYKSMPKTTIFCIIGAASISAFPLFSGFVSKAMIMTAVIYEGYDWIWLALLFAAAGVFHHAGIKIPYFAFYAHDSGLRTSEAPKNMLVAMAIAAAFCIGVGCYPYILYGLLPYETDYTAYDTTHVLTQMQLLCFSALAFVWLNLRGFYPPELRSTNLDVEWIYRKFMPCSIRCGIALLKPAYCGVIKLACTAFEFSIIRTLVRNHGPESALTRTWPIGSMVLWVAILLSIYLILNFFM